MTTVLSEVVHTFTVQLKSAGIESPRLDARVLVGIAAGLTPNDVFLKESDELSFDQLAHAKTLLQRRLNGEPVSRIKGEREFWGMSFQLSEGTLDPRPDSETLITAALFKMSDTGDRSLSVLDLGTGTGCLLISLLTEWPGAVGTGIDIDLDAIEMARVNARSLGVGERATFIIGDWCEGLAGAFDVIICNPPYIRDAEIDYLQREVRCFDPVRALSGGRDGLSAYRRLIPEVANHLNPNGIVILELGVGQVDTVSSLLRASNFNEIEAHNDLSGQARCLIARGP